MRTSAKLALACALAVTGVSAAAAQTSLPPTLTVHHGAINGVFIEADAGTLVIYGDPLGRLKRADMVLFTHARRDVVWAGEPLVAQGARSVVGADEAKRFTEADGFWKAFVQKRFHDYSQDTTRVPTEPIRVDRTVKDRQVIQWRNLSLKVLETPGLTKGSVSYFLESGGRRYGFVGDLIYGEGQFLDLYSLQEAVPAARIGGYHGYAGRIGDLIRSLRTVKAENAHMLVPARGPVIERPAEAIDRLIRRLQAVYGNYLSINAGHWYFKERYDTLAERALGSSDQVQWMPYAATVHKSPPDWVVPIHNSRLILSGDGAAFLVDCGSQAIINEIVKLQEAGRFTSLDGLFVTHYHDDHTENVNELVARFGCPVYVSPCMADVLERPHAYRLPAMTAKPIRPLKVMPDGESMRWREYTLTFYDFPGQTIYHDAMLVQREDDEKVFFIGDSFTPSGIDDYCLQNRNLFYDGMGYRYCLRLIREKAADALLVNQHVVEPFRFEPGQRRHVERVLRQREQLLNDLFPWDGANFGTDEQWVRIFPYGVQARPGQSVETTIKILNHSPVRRDFTVKLNVADTLVVTPTARTVGVEPGEEGEASFRIRIPDQADNPVYVVTADVRFGEWDLRRWCEGLIEVRADGPLKE